MTGPEPDPRLDRYLATRDFTVTAEPVGGGGGAGEVPRFVVQQHAARRMHWDVRLEVDGVLVSWAVPRGPSYDPQAKRLAVQTEDHPLDYAGFEGTIPRGQYGGGAVVVWDAGRYHNLTVRSGRLLPMTTGVERGHVKVWLEGEKLQGAWALSRITGDGPPGSRTGERDWLMVKVADAAAEPGYDVVAERPESVLTGRTVEQVAVDPDGAVWTSDRPS